MLNQKGIVPLLLLVAALGVIGVITITTFAPFRDNLLAVLFPKTASQAAIDEWTQDGHDAQRTGVTSEEPSAPWTFAWAFNGPDANGGLGGHIQDAPKEARVITGGAHIYAPLGPKGLFALKKTDGSVAWNRTETSFNATPAYEATTQTIIAGGSDGKVYKIDANSGSVIATYTAGSAINKSILLVGQNAYALSLDGKLHKINISSMTAAWVYTSGSTPATLPSYSSSRNVIIFATNDLFVHAVNNADGAQKWRVKPTPNNPGDSSITAAQTVGGVKVGTQFEYGWPVIAEQNGIVFVRLQLRHQAIFEGPNNGKWANTNTENRVWLAQNPQWKNLFALNLDDGSEKFIPAVGYGSTEDYIPSLSQAYGVMGAQPIVKRNSDGSEVAYMFFRNGQTSPESDYRWSGHMGEMVLNDTTISGMQAGDLRFVRMSNYGSQGGTAPVHIIDEQTPLTMAGNMLFDSHWAATNGVTITDRSVNKGLNYSDPINTTNLPSIVRAQTTCANFNPTTHYTTCDFKYPTDGGRYIKGPGFWGYWNIVDPPGWRIGSGNTAGTAYSAGFLPRYTFASDGLMITEGNGGELLVFKHSGSIVSPSPSPSVIVSTAPSPSSPSGSGPAISNINLSGTTVKVFEKEEIKFDLATKSEYPFTSYDPSPPPGVQPGIGVSVEGTFSANGKSWKQPGFYMTETVQNGSASSMYFTETGNKYWVIRFSPQETGTYQVSIKATDASGVSSTIAGTFTATVAAKPGFIKVSSNDKRYFEFSNGNLFFPIGPANNSNNSYAGYKGNGPNLERPWLGGRGIYSTNWARWKSSAENQGNEGFQTRLNFQEKLPGHDLSYELAYPQGYRLWQTTWLDDMFGPRIISGKRYQVKFVYKTVGLAGPRIAGQPYGLVAKTGPYPWSSTSADQFENSLRNASVIVNNDTANHDWTTVNTVFIASSNQADIFLMLDNVTAGQAYVDEFSMRECLNAACNSLGGEVIRNPRADEHMFIEQRPAAFIDWQVTQGEQNDVFFKYVVHDKNDWIQNHLLANGQWATTGDGYYQPENTKARWLLRQWYRYLIARWGYSTAIHSWELNNEGPPNEESPGTAAHWRTAEAFAKFMHDNDAHPHLATTSFWCCWRPNFWGNNTLFPDIDYADLHMYTDNIENNAVPNGALDLAMWTFNTSMYAYNNGFPSGQKGVSKPIMRGETGIGTSDPAFNLLKQTNPGIWYHNLLWGQLNEGAMFETGYWWSEHFAAINQIQIAKPFWDFVKDLDLNKGGYNAVNATSSSTNLRVLGQKNLARNKAHIWVQNATHTWKNVMDNLITPQSGTISITMNPSTSYTITTWNTYTATTTTQPINSDSAGKITLALNNLTDDVAYQISSSQNSSPSPVSSASGNASKSGDIAAPFGVVDIFDYNRLLTDFGKTGAGLISDIEKSGSSNNKVDIFDYNLLLTNFGK